MAAAHRRRDRERRKFHRGLTEALLQFARAHFALSKPDKRTGKTRLQILLDIQRQTGVTAPELKDLPEVPSEAAHVWRWFCALGGARGSGMAINPIAWSDMTAFFALAGVKPAGWEVEAIRGLDDAYLLSRTDDKGGVVKGAKALKGRMTGKTT